MKLFYNGGNVVLENVKFINCIFPFKPTDQARQVLDYAALDQSSSLRLGLNFPPRITVGLNGR